MTVEAPSSSRQLQRVHWDAYSAIRSGADAAVQSVGIDGIVAETNHACAYAVRVLGACSEPNGGTLSINATATYVEIARLPVTLSEAIDTWTVAVDCADTDLRITATGLDGNDQQTGSQVARGVKQITLTPTSKVYELLIEHRRNTTSSSVYAWIAIEDEQTAGDLP